MVDVTSILDQTAQQLVDPSVDTLIQGGLASAPLRVGSMVALISSLDLEEVALVFWIAA
jgi:hypothetical protein